MKCDVYYNLHKHKLSVRHKGKVIGHHYAALIKNPKFVVQPAGRDKVRREKRKNVHAFVRGELVDTSCLNYSYLLRRKFWKAARKVTHGAGAMARDVSYNPLYNDSFTTGQGPIKFAKYALVYGNKIMATWP